MCLRFQLCIDRMVFVLHFLKNSQICCTILYNVQCTCMYVYAKTFGQMSELERLTICTAVFMKIPLSTCTSQAGVPGILTS